MLNRRLLPILVLAAGALFGGGCIESRYEIELEPDGDRLIRRITLLDDSDPEVGEVERLNDLYGADPEPLEDGQQWSRRIETAPPQDIGNRGWRVHYATPAGSATGYLERFRGSDDYAAELELRHTAVDELIGLARAWLKFEAPDDPDAATLDRLLAGPVRDDLRNLVILVYGQELAGGAVDDHDRGRLTAAVVSFAADRSWIRPADVADWQRAGYEANELERPQRLIGLIQRAIARKMGTAEDAPIPPLLRRLGDLERLRSSYAEFTRQADFTQAAERFGNRFRKLKSVQELPSALLAEAYFPMFFRDRDQVTVRLKLEEAPLAASGAWDEGELTWERTVGVRGVPRRHPPAVFYGVWVRPDEKWQRRHWGGTLLDGDDLLKYAAWYGGLTDAEQAAWDALQNGLVGGDGLEKQLTAFRFPGEPPAAPPTPLEPNRRPQPSPLAKPIIRLLLDRQETLRGAAPDEGA